MKIGYARVSTNNQDLTAQRNAFRGPPAGRLVTIPFESRCEMARRYLSVRNKFTLS